jgi:hypothetical protein
MPVGIPTPKSLTPPEFENSDFFGFLEATVQAPPSEYIGLLPIRMGGRLVCPVGSFKGFFFSEELRFALANGYTLDNIYEAWGFQKGVNTFKALIEQLNTMKVKAQEEGKPVLRNIAKLLMNSMYGRFGMHVDHIIHEITTAKQAQTIWSSYEVISCIPFQGGLQLISYMPRISDDSILSKPLSKGIKGIKLSNPRPGQTNVPIAAAVTAYSRMIINGFKLLCQEQNIEIFYSDTDSLVTKQALPDVYLDSAALGKLKLEHKIKEGYFVAPKIYWLETEEGEEVTKCKGYPGKLTKDQILDLYEGKSLDLTIERWVRDLATGTVRIQQGVKYQLNPTFNKRQKVFEKGKWVNTHPLVLNPK